MRLIRFMRLLRASVGPLVTFEMCQLVIWGGPAGDGATQLVDLGWAGFVLEVVCELEGVSESEGRTVDPVDASDRFLRVPGCAHFAVGVTSVEETTQPYYRGHTPAPLAALK